MVPLCASNIYEFTFELYRFLRMDMDPEEPPILWENTQLLVKKNYEFMTTLGKLLHN